jgi:hypothetical protein
MLAHCDFKGFCISTPTTFRSQPDACLTRRNIARRGRFSGRTWAFGESPKRVGHSRPESWAEFESGRFAQQAPVLAAPVLHFWLNENSDFFELMHGDKETFHLAFERLRHYTLVPTPVKRSQEQCASTT